MSMSVANSSTYLDPGSQRNRSTSQEFLVPRSDSSVKKYKILTAIFALLTVVLIIVVAVVAVKKKNDGPGQAPAPAGTTVAPEPPRNVCYRPECRDAAAHFLTIMDLDKDPCEDFFGYVCGKWSNETEIPKQKSKTGIFDDLQDHLAKTCIEALEDPEAPDPPVTAVDNARALYQACVNTENVDTKTGVIQLQNILTGVDLNDAFKLSTILSKITMFYGLNYIISFSVTPDDKNTTNNIITLDQPEDFGLPRNFLLGNRSDPVAVAYRDYITQSLCLLNETAKGNCTYLKTIVDDIYNFEVDIVTRTRDPVERRSAATWYFKMSFEDLQKNVTQFDFLQYSKDILNMQGQNVTAKTQIIVKEETYLKNITDFLLTVDPVIQANYLRWRLIQTFGPMLFKDFRKIQFQFIRVLQGIKEPVDIKSVCFDMTNAFYGHAVGRLYIDKAFDENSKKDVEEMVINLAAAFRGLLKNDWMDDATKKQANAKLEKMIEFIGFPEWTKNDTELNKFYQGVQMNKTDMEKSIAIMTFLVEKSFAQLNQLNNRKTEWVTTAAIVNAFYNPSANSITFPAGILQIPFYGKRPRFLNYGAIGTVIGHEITHGYDDQGSEFDGEGNFVNWWSNDTKAKFDKGKQCFIDQYTNITDPLTGRNLNGLQTIGENIADNGGIREAYQAYLLSNNGVRDDERLPGFENFDDLKMFYMSAASVWCIKYRKEGMINAINDDVHAPGIYRAYVPLSNTDDFAQVFNCPKGTQMNPTTKCRIW